MRKVPAPYLFILAFLVSTAPLVHSAPAATPAPGQVISLEEGWEFLPGVFAAADDPLWTTRGIPVRVPSTWNDLVWDSKKAGQAEGHGTFRIRLELPTSSQHWALDWKIASSAAALYWDGKFLHRSGTTASTEALELPANKPSILPLSTGGSGWLVIHVSNHHHVDGGLWSPILLGPLDALTRQDRLNSAYDLFLAGGFFLFGILGISIVFVMRNQKASLWFGLLTIMLGLRFILHGNLTIYHLFPDFDWQWFQKVRHFTMYLVPVFFVRFLAALLPGLFHKRFICGSTILGAAGCLAVLVLPYLLFGNLLYAYLIVFFFQLAYLLVRMFTKIITRSSIEASLSLAGILTFLAGGTYDLLKVVLLLPLPNILPLATLGLVALVSIALGHSIASAYLKLDGLNRQIHSINKSLHRFFPKEFLSLLGKDTLLDVSLGESRPLDMAVLFADIKGFSQHTQGMDPGAIFAMINTFTGIIGPAVRMHGGYVDKYLGDGIMALFPKGGSSAVHAAIAMHQALDTYNQRADRRLAKALEIGTGIHQGPLLLGTIGEEERMEGTVLSSVVNLASRLESLTRDYHARIIISPAVLMDLPPDTDLEYRFLGFENLKGFDQPQPAYEVISADPPELRAQKRQSKEALEEALLHMGRHDYSKANIALKDLKRRFPDDPAPRTYLERIRTIMERRLLFRILSRIKQHHPPRPH